MKRALAALIMAISVSSVAFAGGTAGSKAAAHSTSESPFTGTWSGKLPSGTPVRIVVSPHGSVNYYYKGDAQRLTNIKLSPKRLSATVGTNGSTVTLSPAGAYVFTWGPTGEITRTSLKKS